MNLQPVTLINYLTHMYSAKREPLLFTMILLAWTIILKFDVYGISTLCKLNYLYDNYIMKIIIDIIFIISITITLTVIPRKFFFTVRRWTKYDS
jgi:hypothetical protein